MEFVIKCFLHRSLWSKRIIESTKDNIPKDALVYLLGLLNLFVNEITGLNQSNGRCLALGIESRSVVEVFITVALLLLLFDHNWKGATGTCVEGRSRRDAHLGHCRCLVWLLVRIKKGRQNQIKWETLIRQRDRGMEGFGKGPWACCIALSVTRVLWILAGSSRIQPGQSYSVSKSIS